MKNAKRYKIKIMIRENFKKKKLPSSPGVYLFTKGRKILYVGKATSLKDRVKSYLSKDILSARGPLIAEMIQKANEIKFIPADSVLEALLLESRLIKVYQPPFNSKDKDNKSFNYICVTKEDFPRVLLVREREIELRGAKNYEKVFGPFPQEGLLKEALKIVRKIFPFRDKCLPASISQRTLQMKSELKEGGRLFPHAVFKNSKEFVVGKPAGEKSCRPCFNRQIGLCPGVCTGEVSKAEYRKTIRNIILFMEGKKRTLIKSLEKEMKKYAHEKEFEKAEERKKTIFALQHIQDVTLLKRERVGFSNFRIEAYDISHMSEENRVGVMTVVENGETKKSNYRKFKIWQKKGGDVGALKEILSRRLTHSEWPLPSIFVVDGGASQRNSVEKTLSTFSISIPVVSVVKDEHHKPRKILGDVKTIRKYGNSILLANSEAHRFAMAFHLLTRGRSYKVKFDS